MLGEKSVSSNKQSYQDLSNEEEDTANIFVAVRLRPLSQKEQYISTFETAKLLNEKYVVLLDP